MNNLLIHFIDSLALALFLMFFCLLQGGDKQYELVKREKSDISTIMYTSGTTGEPKGVLISNESIITLIAGVNRFLESSNEEVLFSWLLHLQ